MGGFLRSGFRSLFCNGLPHVRGGVSLSGDVGFRAGRSSPRAWGCFPLICRLTSRASVFPTCVGVFPFLLLFLPSHHGLPHVRGGVSHLKSEIATVVMSSPRAWGCFSLLSKRSWTTLVFPTCVGVFPDWGRTGRTF